MSDPQAAPAEENSGPQGKLVPIAHNNVPTALKPYGDVGAYMGGAYEAQDNFGFDFREYWRIFNKRKWLILSVLVAFGALGAVRTLMKTPLYTATVRLQIDRHAAEIVKGGNINPSRGGYNREFLKTQYELLKSRALAARVASALKLGDDDDFFAPRQVSIIGAVRGLFTSHTASKRQKTTRRNRERAATGIILGNSTVRPIPGSVLVDVAYTDPVPSRAQRIANALAKAFIASNLDKRFQANAYAKTFLEDQLVQLKLRLQESEKTLLDFAQKEQIVAVTEKASSAENNFAAANATLGQLVAERIKHEQLWEQVSKATAINLPQLLTNNVIEGLRNQRNVLVTEYQEKLETFKPRYPSMVRIQNKIKEIDRQLGAEVQTIKDSLKARYEASESQEAEMKKQIVTLRSEVLDLQKRSIQYNILKREVDTNRELYNGLLQRHKEVSIAGGVGANNVLVVDKAEVPGGPSSPRLRRALLLSLALGLGAGLGAAYLLEYLDDAVRSPEALEEITGLTTLGVIPKIADVQHVETEFADPRSVLCEAYRSLCTALQFSTESGLPKTLLVTSAGPGEGKSITAMAIARHFATMSLKVLLIDADLRNPSLHKKLSCDNIVGLSNYLTGGCTPPETFQATSILNLALMTSGPLPPNAADLLGNARLLSLLSVGLEVFDLIVIDSPPIMGLADAPLLSNAANATIFVAGAGQARSGEVRGALKRLQMGRGLLIGAVLTKFDAKAAGYGYGYGYGYGAHDYSYGGASLGAESRSPQLTNANESS
jgi:capsular exopolysaccharide synthesis family protein